MHVGKDLCIAPGAHPCDRVGNVGHGNIVEQDTVGDFAGELKHLRIQRGHNDFRPPITQAHSKTKAFNLPEIALERHRLTRQALAQQSNILAHHSNGPLRQGRSMLSQNSRSGNPQPEPYIGFRTHSLQGCRRHCRKRRRTHLHRHYPRCKIKLWRNSRNSAQQAERVGAVSLHGPQ